jgi:hypothetical protein
VRDPWRRGRAARLEDRNHVGSRPAFPGSLRTGSPVFEYVSPKVFDSLLRRELVSPEPAVVDGYMALPDRPGLGIDLNEKLVERLRADRI